MQLLLNKYFALIGLLFFASVVKAQNDEVTFDMSVNKEKLALNERLRVDFSMNHDGDNFNPPDFSGFDVVMGPGQSISTIFNNGKRSYSKVYSYVLQPKSKGKFTIGQASIVIESKTYKSLAKQIEVTGAVDNPNAPPTAESIADENLHLVAEVSNANPYMNEAISVVYKLYVDNINVTNFRALDNPKYNNFWSQDMPVKQYSVEEGTYDGKPYKYVVLKRIVLYPQKTGKLDIEPLSLAVSLEVPSGRRDFFGRPLYTSTNKTVSAGNRTIDVKELPLEGKPANFNGAVGDFNFDVTTSKTVLNAAESLQAIVKVSGSGNLKLFQLPEPSLPSSLEVFAPEFEENINTNISGMEGSVQNNYTIVPSFKGKYPIPSISFSFFNPKTEKYRTINSDEILINVPEGPTSGTSSINSSSENTKQDVVATGNQFQFIKLKTNLHPKGNNYFFGSKSYFLWLLLPLLLIPMAIIFGKKREAILGDVAGNKIKKANRLARKYLSAAKKTLGKKDAFYVALEKALHNYLKAKLKIETSEFSKDKISQLLLEKQVDMNTSEGFISLLKNCEMARYSPFSDVQMQEDYNNASEVISAMDKQL